MLPVMSGPTPLVGLCNVWLSAWWGVVLFCLLDYVSCSACCGWGDVPGLGHRIPGENLHQSIKPVGGKRWVLNPCPVINFRDFVLPLPLLTIGRRYMSLTEGGCCVNMLSRPDTPSFNKPAVRDPMSSSRLQLGPTANLPNYPLLST